MRALFPPVQVAKQRDESRKSLFADQRQTFGVPFNSATHFFRANLSITGFDFGNVGRN